MKGKVNSYYFNRRKNNIVTQTNLIRGSKTFTQSTLTNPIEIMCIRNHRHCSSKQIILKTLRQNKYNSLKSIQSFIKQNITKEQLEINLDSIEDQKEKEQLFSIISEWKHFTFCKFELNANIKNEIDINAHQLDDNSNNLFIHRIFDLNSQKNNEDNDDEKEEEKFNLFIELKSKSAEEKSIVDIPLYQNAFSSILHNDLNENIRLKIINKDRNNSRHKICNLVLCNHINITKKKMLKLRLKQIMLLCYKYKQIKAESQRRDCFALEHINLTDFKRRINFFNEENNSKMNEFLLISHINTNIVEIEFSTINYIGKRAINNHKGITVGKYTIQNEITKGLYWQLYSCINSITKEMFYIKVIMKKSIEYVREKHYYDLFMMILSSFKSIAHVREVMESNNYQYIILEIEESDNGSQIMNNVAKYTKMNKELFAIDHLKTLIRDLLYIVDYSSNVLKANNIDLSPNNFFCNAKGNLWLCSFQENKTNYNKPLITELITLINSLTDRDISFDLINSNPNDLNFLSSNSPLVHFVSDLQKENISFSDIKNHSFIISKGKYAPSNIYDYAIDESNRIVNLQIKKAKIWQCNQ